VVAAWFGLLEFRRIVDPTPEVAPRSWTGIAGSQMGSSAGLSRKLQRRPTEVRVFRRPPVDAAARATAIVEADPDSELWEGLCNVRLTQIHRDRSRAAPRYSPAEFVRDLLAGGDAAVAEELAGELAVLVARPGPVGPGRRDRRGLGAMARRLPPADARHPRYRTGRSRAARVIGETLPKSDSPDSAAARTSSGVDASSGVGSDRLNSTTQEARPDEVARRGSWPVTSCGAR